MTFTGTLATTGTTITRVKSATEFGGFTSFSSGTYIEIAGTGLSDTTRVWEGRDFASGGLIAPTVLDNVRVTVNGVPAFTYYISPTQLNVVTPADVSKGLGEVRVTTPSGRTATTQVQKVATTPGFLLPASFSTGGRQYLAAQFPDQVYVGRAGLVQGVSFRPAKPGENITVYGLGFGDVAPYFAPGSVATQATQLVLPLSVSFGSTLAEVSYRGLAPNFVNLYQFNITVPVSLADVDYQINVTLGGQALQQPPFFLTVHCRQSAPALLPKPNGGNGRLYVSGWIRGSPKRIARCHGVGGQLAPGIETLRIDQFQKAMHRAHALFREIGFRLRAVPAPGKRFSTELQFHVEPGNSPTRLQPEAGMGGTDRLHLRARQASIRRLGADRAKRIAVFVDWRETRSFCSAKPRRSHTAVANRADDVDLLNLRKSRAGKDPEDTKHPQGTTQAL